MDDPNFGCAHVFIGIAANTIVRLLVELTEHPDQNILLEGLVTKQSTEKVYSLSFDYIHFRLQNASAARKITL